MISNLLKWTFTWNFKQYKYAVAYLKVSTIPWWELKDEKQVTRILMTIIVLNKTIAICGTF